MLARHCPSQLLAFRSALVLGSVAVYLAIKLSTRSLSMIDAHVTLLSNSG